MGDGIACTAVVDFSGEVQPFVEESQVDRQLHVPCLLPTQVRVGGVLDVAQPVGTLSRTAELVEVVHHQLRVDRLVDVAGVAEGGTQRQAAHCRLQCLHEGLLHDVPSQSQRAGRAELFVLAEVVRAIRAGGEAQDVAVQQHVVHREVERGEGVLLDALSRQSVHDGGIGQQLSVVGLLVGWVDRHGGVARYGVIAVTLLIDGFGILSAYLCTTQQAEVMGIPDGEEVVELSAQVVVGVVGGVLADGAVPALRLVVVSLEGAVHPCRVGVLADVVVGMVGDVAEGAQSLERQVLQQLHAHAGDEGGGEVPVLCIRLIHLTQDVEPLLGQGQLILSVRNPQVVVGAVCRI